jgi:hypothetical protein
VSRIALLVNHLQGAIPRPEHMQPDWQTALMEVAHRDDETFGLAAIVDRLTSGDTALHLLCFTPWPGDQTAPRPVRAAASAPEYPIWAHPLRAPRDRRRVQNGGTGRWFRSG